MASRSTYVSKHMLNWHEDYKGVLENVLPCKGKKFENP